MFVLGIETATRVGSVAVVNDDQLVGEYTLNVGLTHSERLLPVVDHLLKSIDVSFSRIDAMAVSLGPGSFTGLRIGVSTIKGLLLAAEKPLVGVPTLDSLAHNYPCSEIIICPMLDARKNEVFTAFYRWETTLALKKLTPDLALSPQKLLQNITEKVIFLGDGSQVYRSLIEETLGPKAFFVPPHLSHPRAGTIAWLGLEAIKKGKTQGVDQLTPIYVRSPEVERRKMT